MNNFHIPYPPSSSIPTRSDRIKNRAPQAANALARIGNTRARIRYGSPISEFLNGYHFLPISDVRSYFSQYLSQKSDQEPQLDIVDNNVALTLNLLPPTVPQNVYRIDRAFEIRFSEFLKDINKSEDKHKSLLAFVVGPTGSGKTAFSTAFFTVSLENFWRENIIPCRVEYSRIKRERGASDIDRRQLFSVVRQSQLRDLLAYLLLYKRDEFENFRSELRVLTASVELEEIFLEFISKHSTGKFDGENIRVNEEIRGSIRTLIQKLDDKLRDEVLYFLSDKLDVRFFISFDGFDSITIDNFLFDEKEPAPISYLIEIVRGLHSKNVQLLSELHRHAIRCHYIIYLRDTTFEILQSRIFMNVSERKQYPHYWIVPPRYGQMVRNAVTVLSDEPYEDNENVKTLVNDVRSALSEFVFRKEELVQSAEVATLFGSNARRIKAHIAAILESALERGLDRGVFDYTRERGGIQASLVWQALVKGREVAALPGYVIIEDLYLDETRQLFPKLRLDSELVTENLNAGLLKEVISKIEDKDESAGTFGCIFNYFYRGKIECDSQQQPMLLVLVRIIQFVKRFPRRNIGDVKLFLSKIGYNLEGDSLRFMIYLLIRVELIKWDSTSGGPHLSDASLFVTKMGIIIHDRLLHSITYLSEAVLCSLHLDRDLSDLLKPRVTEKNIWVADCINNSLVAVELIDRIETIEDKKAKLNGIDFSIYSVFGHIKSSIVAEGKSILRGSSVTQKRWVENVDSLRASGFNVPEELEI